MLKRSQSQNDSAAIFPLISSSIPTCSPSDTLDKITELLTQNSWDDMDYVFVLSQDRRLLGFIDMAALGPTNKSTQAATLMKKPENWLKDSDTRQKAVILAVRFNMDIIPVLDGSERFVGALISKTIISLMHSEHLENALLTSGIVAKKHHVVSIASVGIVDVVRYRLPWLIVGLTAGLGLGFISSFFEDSLRSNIAIAYFIPVVAYIADSVGTQSEAIAVRSLATLKVKAFPYILREFLVGSLLGIVMGLLGGIGAVFISGQPQIGLVVGISLFVASTLAATLATTIPMIFKLLDKDPALGSGPLATAIQDVLSIVIYFVFVVLLI